MRFQIVALVDIDPDEYRFPVDDHPEQDLETDVVDALENISGTEVQKVVITKRRR